MLKPRFPNKTGNRFVKTGFLPVIGLCDVMYHMATSSQKAARGKVKHGYVITTSTVCSVVCEK